MDKQSETISRLEHLATSFEVQIQHLEERQKKCDDNSDRITVLETRHEETVKRSARLAQIWSLVTGVVVGILTKLYDHFAASAPHAH